MQAIDITHVTVAYLPDLEAHHGEWHQISQPVGCDIRYVMRYFHGYILDTRA